MQGYTTSNSQNSKEIRPRTSSIFKDGLRICKVQREEKLSQLAVFMDDKKKIACPERMIPCNSNAKMTICAKSEKLSTDCPITDIKLILKKDYDAENFAGYSIAEAPKNVNWYLLVSRTAAELLPLTTFHLTEF